jgi:hypothetical protein
MEHDLEQIIQELHAALKLIEDSFRQHWKTAISAEQSRSEGFRHFEKQASDSAIVRERELKEILENCRHCLQRLKKSEYHLYLWVAAWLNHERVKKFSKNAMEENSSAVRPEIASTHDPEGDWQSYISASFEQEDEIHSWRITKGDLELVLKQAMQRIRDLRNLEIDLNAFRARAHVIEAIKAIASDKSKQRDSHGLPFLRRRTEQFDDGDKIATSPDYERIRQYVRERPNKSNRVIAERAVQLRRLARRRRSNGGSERARDSRLTIGDWVLAPKNSNADEVESDVFNAVVDFLFDPTESKALSYEGKSPKELAEDLLRERVQAFNVLSAPIERRTQAIGEQINALIEMLSSMANAPVAEKPQLRTAESEATAGSLKATAVARSLIQSLAGGPNETATELSKRRQDEIAAFENACESALSQCIASLNGIANAETKLFDDLMAATEEKIRSLEESLADEQKKCAEESAKVRETLNSLGEMAYRTNALQILGVLPLIAVYLIFDHWGRVPSENPLEKFLSSLRHLSEIRFYDLDSPESKKVAREAVVIGAAIRTISLSSQQQESTTPFWATSYLATNWLELVVRENRNDNGQKDRREVVEHDRATDLTGEGSSQSRGERSPK